jgi:hypothetical protein
VVFAATVRGVALGVGEALVGTSALCRSTKSESSDEGKNGERMHVDGVWRVGCSLEGVC